MNPRTNWNWFTVSLLWASCILSLNCDLTYKCRMACTSLFFMPKILNHHNCTQYNLRGYTVTASDMCVYFHRFFQDKKGIEPLDAIKHRWLSRSTSLTNRQAYPNIIGEFKSPPIEKYRLRTIFNPSPHM